MTGLTLDNLVITETFYGWYNKTNEVIDFVNSLAGDGISGATVDNGILYLILTDNSSVTAGYVQGPSGEGFIDASIIDGFLVLGLDNGDSVTAGYVQGNTGTTGNTGSVGATGASGLTGPTGEGVPTGGNIGFALVKATNDDYDTEWADVSSVARSHPGKIGGYEGGTGSLIFGEGQAQTGRELFPRWSTNYYLSQVHTGLGISMSGATGLYSVAATMDGFTTGYDDGLTAGIKVLNFLENTLPFEGNVYTEAGSECLGRTLDSPPGYYWNRMKYFPTVKLQPFYVGNYSYIDKYIGYITGYENNIPAARSDRRGVYAWFGVIPVNSFPTGTPQSETTSYDGFVAGSTCAYFLVDSGVGLCGNGFAVSQTNSEFGVDGITTCAWTGDYVRSVTPGRTGPIAFYPEAAGSEGLQDGFVLSPGWYYLLTEFIPTAWFSMGSDIDTRSPDGDGFEKGFSADHVSFTHTDASNGQGDISLFGLNGFELAPENEPTGVGNPFTPSAYLGISSFRQGMETVPTGLAPYLWYTQGLSAGGEGRFGTGGDYFNYLKGHIGLHQLDDTVSNAGAITIRPQTAEQASAPRIAMSIRSSASQLDSLRNIDLGTNPPGSSNFCTFTWNGLSPWSGTGGVGTQCADCQGGTVGDDGLDQAFDWHRLLYGGFIGTSSEIAALGGDENDISWSDINGSIEYKIQLSCDDGSCPTFCAPPGIPVATTETSHPVVQLSGVAAFDGAFKSPGDDLSEWLAFGGTTIAGYGEPADGVLVDPSGNVVYVPFDPSAATGEYGFTQSITGSDQSLRTWVFDESAAGGDGNPEAYGYGPGANQGGPAGYNCPSHFPGTTMNPYSLTSEGVSSNTEQGWIQMFDDTGNTYFFGFYNGETAATNAEVTDTGVSGATSGCVDCFRSVRGSSGDFTIDDCTGNPLYSAGGGFEDDSTEGVGSGGGPATISTFVNAQEGVHVEWFGTASGTEKNHLVKYTSTYGCTAGTDYPEYEGP